MASQEHTHGKQVKKTPNITDKEENLHLYWQIYHRDTSFLTPVAAGEYSRNYILKLVEICQTYSGTSHGAKMIDEEEDVDYEEEEEDDEDEEDEELEEDFVGEEQGAEFVDMGIKNFNALIELDLSDNNITALPPEVGLLEAKLQVLKLDGNPLRSIRQLCWSYAHYVTKKMRTFSTFSLVVFFARQLWYSLLHGVGLSIVNPQATELSWEDWWMKEEAAVDGDRRKGLNTLIMLHAWTIWRHKNDRVLNGATPTLDGATPCKGGS